MRDLVIAQLKRREQAADAGVTPGDAGNGQPENFAEQKGGLY